MIFTKELKYGILGGLLLIVLGLTLLVIARRIPHEEEVSTTTIYGCREVVGVFEYDYETTLNIVYQSTLQEGGSFVFKRVKIGTPTFRCIPREREKTNNNGAKK